MSLPVLQVSNLGKAYRQYHSELNRVASWFGLPTKPASEHWVLRGISFAVDSGKAIGIVGQNGAGKSTLLKLITGTQRPTQGNISINGRVAAILELGMGFNPEFTGRQNAYHAVGLMGFYEGEIEAVMPEIEEFAEIGEYFDQPVHTYSSGMQMRVAFAVVTAFRPEILIVDEALSVGDTYFQHKSFSRIREFQKQGTTLLIVSHDPGAIQTLCDRAILLENGTVIKDGNPEEVLNYYNAMIADKEKKTIAIKPLATGKVQTVSGTREAEVDSVILLNNQNEPAEIINVGEPVTLKVRVKINKELPSLVLGYMIKNRFGQDIYGTNTWHTQQPIKDLDEGETLTYSIHFNMNLGPGNYSISTALISSNIELLERYEWCDLMSIFSVVNLDKIHFGGIAWIEPIFVVDRDR
ncbi:MAG: ABC transporter ATP-binding protein [Nodosilinea sp. LVE1205-7]|jgi:lipopolysaccharide transport system ATP-binding protein